MPKFRLSLKYKITLFVSFLIFLLFILTNYIITKHEKNILYENLIQKGNSLIKNFTLQCENAFFTGDELKIEDDVTVLMKDREIINVHIILLNNQTYFLSDKEELLGQKYISPLRTDSNPTKMYNIILSGNKKLYQFYLPVYRLNRQKRPVIFGMAYIELTTDNIKIKLNLIRKNLFIIFISLLLAGVTGAFLLSRFMTNPIKKLINSINIIAKGDLKHKINIKTRDEIENLADEFNKMTTQLANYQKKLIRQKIVEQELQIAHDIQSRIIPDKLINVEQYEMFNFYRSSRTIGGDYHNLIPINNSEYLIVIADVAGKGIPASLLMAMFHTVLITLKSLHNNPLTLIKVMNTIMSGLLKRGDFITALIGLLNKKTDKIEIVTAGHEHPVFINFKDRTLNFLRSSSLPMGLLGKAEFESKLDILEYKLLKDNLMLFFTDGIRNIRKKPFNNNDLDEFFSSLVKSSNNYVTFKNRLFNQIDLKKYDDDLTIMGIMKAGRK